MIIVKINSVDKSDQINWDYLTLSQILTNEVDTLNFSYSKYADRTYIPAINDHVELYDGIKKLFGGYVVNIEETNLSGADGINYQVQAADYSVKLGGVLVAKSYLNQTISQILTDLITSFAPGYTATNIVGTFVVGRIVFNEEYLTDCIKKLAEIVKYDWYIDEEKDLHFFPKMTNAAPFGLTDTSGNYVANSLARTIDGTQIVNQVKVRGGEADGSTYTDIITVNGSISKSFKLPYKFSNLAIELDTGGGYVVKTVGQDFKDDPATKDCLYSFTDSVLKFPANLADGNKIKFTGNPKVPIKSIISNAGSIAQFGLREKIINDSSIVDMATARKRAKAELSAYQYGSNEISFNTYTSGLRAGMVLNLNSAKRETSGAYVINRITFTTKSPTEFVYNVNAITTNRLQLIDLLQKLTKGDQGELDESVIAETIWTDMSDVEITEIIRKVSALLDQVNLAHDETIHQDPLGPGVEPIWVLGPHVPTSATDPKRPGRLDISMKLY